MNSSAERFAAALAGRYRIERELGAGGMATVYLAEDLKHDRKVAIKVLRPELAAVLGGERFVVEIKTTAALSHPHILPLFDSGTADGFLFYVMPYIQGETIREQLNRETQFGVDDAVRIAREVADALDYAHRHGVIHRDIKPENILLHDGRAMVMDFGIALAVSAAAGGRMTETGLSLGTPHYMSPEQATAEKEITPRSDVYSLASVLYEMLAGQPPHIGGAAQQVIMKIITEPAPPVTTLRKSVPPNVAAAVAKALEKLPADRFESAKAFAEALANAGFTAMPSGAAHARARATGTPWFVKVLAATAIPAMLLAAYAWLGRPTESNNAVTRYSLSLPKGQEISGWSRRLAISPDGSRLVYVGATDRNMRQLMLRPRDQLHASAMPGTEGAEAPFFSPDGTRVGFFSPRGTLRIATLSGETPVILTDSVVGVNGASWGRDGFIYADGLGRAGLVRVPAAGGVPERFTTLDTAAGEMNHVWPDVLPSGKGVLFSVKYKADPLRSEIAVADVATGKHHLVVSALYATYATSGHLLYVTRDGKLLAQSFDERNLALSGNPVSIAEGVSTSGVGAPDFVPDLVMSASGTMLYLGQTGLSDSTEVVWVDRSGAVRPVDPSWTDQLLQGVALSPDGTRLAYSTGGEIWVKQLDRGPRFKFTFSGGNRPAWTPDGKNVLFGTTRDGYANYYIRPTNGTGTARRFLDTPQQILEAVLSKDGQWAIYRQGGGGEADLYARRTSGDTTPVPLVVTSEQETQPTVSPDGRWLAYVTLASGRAEVMVRPFPNVDDGQWQVSPAGGSEPRWAHSGRELFYRSEAQEMISVPIGGGTSFVFGEPAVLFPVRDFLSLIYRPMYDVAPGDQRFLMVRRVVSRPAVELIVVENIIAELRRRVPRQ